MGFSWFADMKCHLADAKAALHYGSKSVTGTSPCFATRFDLQGDAEASDLDLVALGGSSTYCQRRHHSCKGRLFDFLGPKSPPPRTPVGLTVVDWDGDGSLEIVF